MNLNRIVQLIPLELNQFEVRFFHFMIFK
jgi:hypothetical protein